MASKQLYLDVAYWFKYIDWLNLIRISGLHIFAIGQFLYVPIQYKTILLGTIYAILTGGFGLTAGHHRLWCHRAYKASIPLQYALALFGAGAMQGPITFWIRHHRAHHRYVDTNQDPYSARKGMFWAHIGWLFVKDRHNWGKVDMEDVRHDRVVLWQRKYFPIIATIMCFVVPTMVAHFGWDDWKGGFGYAGCLRCVINWHLVWTINSLAHWVGDQPYSDKNTSRQAIWIGLYSMGEGYHNFHHTFPSDYRNGPVWYDIDMSKWLIALWEKLGWASHLNRTSPEDIERCRTMQVLKKNGLEKKSSEQDNELPVWKWNKYVDETRKGRCLVVIAGMIYDVRDFMAEHPGGKGLLQGVIGKDATSEFHGGVYNHSAHADNKLDTLKIAVVDGGGEVKTWKGK
ncbi:putative acyl-CoA desaturase [Talaromyces proteolyticus]|uniref:Acyl-CoA desaturase n=1 Tax=Talaromyces proteolyticus TaxID=1131652 RepID=A0AAD4Q5E7_9EURO|nr:putative acyl-CoA desaturase [Talaromyces proteolyticus]KAH8704119.1 putative acyl-CoA desaturase [Talaromyces proteolyticus]